MRALKSMFRITLVLSIVFNALLAAIFGFSELTFVSQNSITPIWMDTTTLALVIGIWFGHYRHLKDSVYLTNGNNGKEFNLSPLSVIALLILALVIPCCLVLVTRIGFTILCLGSLFGAATIILFYNIVILLLPGVAGTVARAGDWFIGWLSGK